MVAGSHFIGKFVDTAYNYFNGSFTKSGIIIPDEFIDDTLYILDIVERGSGLFIIKANGKTRFIHFGDIDIGSKVIIGKFNLLPMILDNGEGTDYYVGTMDDIMGIVY